MKPKRPKPRRPKYLHGSRAAQIIEEEFTDDMCNGVDMFLIYEHLDLLSREIEHYKHTLMALASGNGDKQ